MNEEPRTTNQEPRRLSRRRLLAYLLPLAASRFLALPRFAFGADKTGKQNKTDSSRQSAATGPAVAEQRRKPDLSFITGKMKLLRRSAWTRDLPETTYLRPLGECNRITIHHQGAGVFKDTTQDSVIAQINSVCEGHRSLKYGDIGYHFIVDYAGRLWEARSIIHEGAHVSRENEHNIGIMALGNCQEQKPSKEQMATVLRIVDLLQHNSGVKPSRIYGHLDIGSTICPGRYLYPAVVQSRKHAQKQHTNTQP